MNQSLPITFVFFNFGIISNFVFFNFQLFVANIITCVYAMVMMLVLIGIVLQIVEDGWTAPSSIFTVATFGIFFVTAALHPQEIICLLYITIYYITIPSMYMLLIIYSLCNLNNVSWGTREVVQKKTVKVGYNLLTCGANTVLLGYKLSRLHLVPWLLVLKTVYCFSPFKSDITT